MSKTVNWLVTVAAVVMILDQMNWLSPGTWYAGWVAFVLVLVAAVMAWMNK